MDRNEFMELVYETFADEPDNVLANGIIEAADAYVEHEKTQLSQEGTTSDLIGRQAVIDVIEDYPHGNMWNVESMGEMVDKIKVLPTVQPEPHEGHWIGSDGSYICSECNGDPLDFIDTMGASCDAYVETLMKFCPNCGAKMSNQNKIKGERQK